jgi:DNA-directed RNA polymerase specialized sigma24 family protein
MSEGEFGDFCRPVLARLRAFAFRAIGDWDTAEEVVQKALRRVLRHLGRITAASVEAYIWQALQWAIADERRRRGKRHAQLQEEMTWLVDTDGPEVFEGDVGELLSAQLSIQSKCREVLCGAVGTMTDRERCALGAWLEADRDNSTALDLLRDSDPEITAEAFAMRVHHARKKLRVVQRQAQQFLAEFPGLNIWNLLVEVIRDAHSGPEGGQS